jgi:hypothetical protein
MQKSFVDGRTNADSALWPCLQPKKIDNITKSVSKRFSLFKVRDGADFNRRNTLRISRLKIGARRRDRAK